MVVFDEHEFEAVLAVRSMRAQPRADQFTA